MNPIVQTIAQTVITSFFSNNSANTATGSNALIQNVLGMLSQNAGPNGNGVANLIQQFQKGGLEDVVSSWVSTGANKPVDATQIQQAMGAEQIQQLAANSGLTPAQTSSQLADLLPNLINQLTPNGSVDNGLIGQIMNAVVQAKKAA